jgi:hypothetical protein
MGFRYAVAILVDDAPGTATSAYCELDLSSNTWENICCYKRSGKSRYKEDSELIVTSKTEN